MPKLRHISALILLLGLVFAELLPSINKFALPQAKGQTALTEEQQKLILNILENNSPTGTTPDKKFIYLDIAGGPDQAVTNSYDVFKDATGLTQPVAPSFGEAINSDGSLTPDILQSISAPAGSDLDTAYGQHGKVFYQKGSNILVIFPNEDIKSYNKTTGAKTTWLAKTIDLPPIRNTEAYYKLQYTYHGEIVAEASDWVLMEFPSGAVLRVGKPEFNTDTTATTTTPTTP